MVAISLPFGGYCFQSGQALQTLYGSIPPAYLKMASIQALQLFFINKNGKGWELPGLSGQT